MHNIFIDKVTLEFENISTNNVKTKLPKWKVTNIEDRVRTTLNTITKAEDASEKEHISDKT